MGRDRSGDRPVATTARALVRIALVAAETAARFERERIQHDPVAWMLAPLRLFGGRRAVEACLEREHCLRAILLHGLSVGLDAEPDQIDALAVPDRALAGGDGSAARVCPASRTGGRWRLWTSTLVADGAGETIHLFDAVVAEDRDDALAQLARRHGRDTASCLDPREGFDEGEPLVEALVSPALADMLRQVAAAPASPLARGLSVSVEQRFGA